MRLSLMCLLLFLQTDVKKTIEPPIKKLEPKLLLGMLNLYIIIISMVLHQE